MIATGPLTIPGLILIACILGGVPVGILVMVFVQAWRLSRAARDAGCPVSFWRLVGRAFGTIDPVPLINAACLLAANLPEDERGTVGRELMSLAPTLNKMGYSPFLLEDCADIASSLGVAVRPADLEAILRAGNDLEGSLRAFAENQAE